MANRVLRDWTFSENIDLLSYPSEVFFTRLIMKADDYGRFYASPKLLKAALFPLREVSKEEIISMLKECNECGIIRLYSDNEKQYLEIVDFGQRLRVMNSKFPEPRTIDSGPRTDDRAMPPERKKETEDETETKETETALTSVVPPSLKFDFKKSLLKFGFDPQLVEEWLKIRKTKKAVNTETALNGFLNEIKKNKSTDPNSILRVCVERSWSGFKSEWLNNLNLSKNGISQSISRDEQTANYTQQVLESIGKQVDSKVSSESHENGSDDFTTFTEVR